MTTLIPNPGSKEAMKPYIISVAALNALADAVRQFRLVEDWESFASCWAKLAMFQALQRAENGMEWDRDMGKGVEWKKN